MSPIDACRWLAPALALALSAGGAAAQVKAWPDAQPPQQQQQPAWPGDSRPAVSGAPQPAAMQPPMTAAPSGPAPMMGAPAMGAAPPGGVAPNPCMGEFTRLRNDVEKAGKVTKAASDRRASREEFCKAITTLHHAQSAWVKYTQDNAKRCGVPPDVVTQLKAGQANLAKMKTNICSGGGAAAGAGPPPAPSLSEALGTSRLPLLSDDVPRKRGGSLDTLTGQAIR